MAKKNLKDKLEERISIYHSDDNKLINMATEIKHIILDLVTFQKMKIETIAKDGSPRTIVKRNPISVLELYAKLEYVASQIKSSESVELSFMGMENIKLGLNFVNSIKRAGASISNTRIMFDMKKFNQDEAESEVMIMKCDVSSIASVDRNKLFNLSKGFIQQIGDLLD